MGQGAGGGQGVPQEDQHRLHQGPRGRGQGPTTNMIKEKSLKSKYLTRTYKKQVILLELKLIMFVSDCNSKIKWVSTVNQKT